MLTVKSKDLFDLDRTIASELLSECEYPWQAIPRIREFISKLGKTLPQDEYYSPSEGVWISKSATVADSAKILPPCIIGKESELRTGAFIRGSVLIGDGCVVGNSCEIKNAILFDKACVPHFNYVGDSILGYRAHTGAGAVTSNVKNDKSEVKVKTDSGYIDTHLKKLGAMIGDRAEIGCNCVLNPGTIIGRDTSVYPLSSVRGSVPADHIYKDKNDIIPKQRAFERS